MNQYELNSDDESAPISSGWYYVKMEEICKNGYYPGREAEWPFAQPVNHAIRFLLHMDTIPAYDRINGKPCTLVTEKFFNDFNEGYANGIEYFDKHFTVSTDTLYQNQEKYVSDLNFHFYDSYIDDITEGWHSIINQEVFDFGKSEVRRQGYYSAIINMVEELVYRYPSLFVDFFVKKTTSPQIETITETLKNNLFKHGFFELQKVKALSPDKVKELLGLMSKSTAGYKVAMLSYLGFIQRLENLYPVKGKLHEAISKITGGAARNIAGEVRTFGSTKEDIKRFKAFSLKPKVETDYQNLLIT